MQPNNNTNPLLGFAIPTFNRCKLLNGVIRQIINSFEQLNEPLFEICISDNGSEDGTEEMVEQWKKHYPQIIYINNGKNLGPQQNITNSFSLTSSKYVWILSDDDEIWENSTRDIIDYINGDPQTDLFLLNRSLCSYDMEFLRHDTYLHKDQDTRTTIHDNNETIQYLENCRTVNGIGCYLSSWVLKRELGEKILLEPDSFFCDNLFPHVYAFWRYALKKHPVNLRYLAQPLVKWRAGNSLATRGLLGRAMHLHLLFREINPSKPMFRQFEHMILGHYSEQFSTETLIKKNPPMDEIVYALQHFRGLSTHESQNLISKIQAESQKQLQRK